MKNRRRLLAFAACLALITLFLFVARKSLIRLFVAASIARLHVFTPPQPLPGESAAHRIWNRCRFYWDFAEIREAREKRVKRFEPELKHLVEEIRRHQKAGQGMQYSMHIYREVRWRLNFTPDEAATERRISDLRASLDQPEAQRLAAEQQEADGSWGMGIEVWYLKLYYSIEDGLDRKDPVVKYPLRFLDPINSPEKLATQLDRARFDDFTKTGIFNREELDETFSAIARLLFRMKDVPYSFDPRLSPALRAYVNQWQNPDTGFWGQWLVDRDGRLWKMDDMAMTFHVVSDLNGQVNDLDRIAKRALQLDDVNFPAGIRFDGHYENHLNWDVVKIFRLAWPYLDEPTRAQARTEIGKMLDWCLKDSYQTDGSFKVSELDDTAGDAYMYGVAFLKDAGYFRRDQRFWTSQDFPEARTVHDRIETKLNSIGTNDPSMRSAYEILRALD
jgi:hypothetical protein